MLTDQETFLIIINVENCLIFFVESLIDRKFEEKKIVTVKIFTVIFGHFNISLLKKRTDCTQCGTFSKVFNF